MILNPYRFGGNGIQTKFGPATSTVAFGVAAIGIVDRTTAVTNGVTIWKLGLFNNQGAKTVKLKVVKHASGTSVVDVVADTGSVPHTGSGWEFFFLPTPYVVPGSGTFWLGGYSALFGTINDYVTDDTESATDILGSGFGMTDHSSRETIVLGYET